MRKEQQMLIDGCLPEFDFRERHQAIIPASPDAVRRAVDEWRPMDSLLWRWLVRLRGLGSPKGSLREWGKANGFLRLAETEYEVVYGQAGRFWAPNERAAMISPRTVEEFRGFNDPKVAVAAMNLLVEPHASGGTRLFTETRVRCLGASSRRWFRLYWLVIRPFSGLLRRAMLSGIRARAISKMPEAPTIGESRGSRSV
jgi:hypothetical protein